MCSEGDARAILGRGDRATRIVKIVEQAWQRHIDDGQVRRKSVRAGIVWNHMVDEAESLLTNQSGIERVGTDEMPMWRVDDRLILRFKKHDRDLLTNNYQTKIQRQVRAVAHLPGLEGATVVNCGYMLDAAESDLQQIVTSKRIGPSVEWHIDMRELAAGVLAPRKPALPLPSAGDEARPALPGIRKPAAERADQGRE